MGEAYTGGCACGVRGYAWDHLDPALPKFDKMPPMGDAH
jgi:hypothetical protein